MFAETALLLCKKCSTIIVDARGSGNKETFTQPPPDWSFIKIGTTGEIQGQPFKIAGRVRLQLRNDYRNFWCAEYERGKCLWIAESFASFSLFTNTWTEYKKSVSKLRAGNWIPINENVKLRGEYVEKCEGISIEGEVARWMLFKPGFFVVQSSNKDGTTAIYLIKDKDNVLWILGDKKSPDAFKLSNIVKWDEWT